MGHGLRLRDAFHTDGSMAIEYGLIPSALLLFTLGIMDTGRLLWTNITLTRAAEVAARCGAVNNATACPGVPASAATEAQNFGIYDAAASNFVATTPACGVQVRDLYIAIRGSMVPAVFGQRALRRHDHDAQRDSLLPEAILRAARDRRVGLPAGPASETLS